MKLLNENDKVECFNKKNEIEIKAGWVQKIPLLMNLNQKGQMKDALDNYKKILMAVNERELRQKLKQNADAKKIMLKQKFSYFGLNRNVFFFHIRRKRAIPITNHVYLES